MDLTEWVKAPDETKSTPIFPIRGSRSRVMPPVCSIGQAAGMAAAMCVEQKCTPAELPGEEVRKNLAAAGARL